MPTDYETVNSIRKGDLVVYRSATGRSKSGVGNNMATSAVSEREDM